MAFNSMNAFRLVNTEGAGRFVRFRFFPEKGEHSLPVEQQESAPPHHLHEDVAAELPIRYRVLAQLAHNDDQTTDPEQGVARGPGVRPTWAGSRSPGPTPRERGDDVLVFDPMRLTDGIEPSDDPSCASAGTSTPSPSAGAPAVPGHESARLDVPSMTSAGHSPLR